MSNLPKVEVPNHVARGTVTLLILARVREEIAMDFITGLPRSKGVDAMLVVVDQLSKYEHFYALKHPFSGRSVG